MSFNSVNRDRSPSLDSVTSVGSTDSKDSGFGVNDVTSQVGHMNGSTVTKGLANPKPSGFFGWLKSLLGFGGSSEKSTHSVTTSSEFTQKMSDKDAAYLASKDWGRVAQQHADSADTAVKSCVAPENKEGVQDLAYKSREAANKAAGAFESRDLSTANKFAGEAQGYANKARALDQLKGLDNKEKIAERRAQEATLKQLNLSPEDAAGYEDRTDKVGQQIHELKTAIRELIIAAKNSDIDSNYKDIRKEPKIKRDSALHTCNEALAGLDKAGSLYSPDEETIAQLDAAGLSYNPATNKIALKKK